MSEFKSIPGDHVLKAYHFECGESIAIERLYQEFKERMIQEVFCKGVCVTEIRNTDCETIGLSILDPTEVLAIVETDM